MIASWKGIAARVLDEAGAIVGADGSIRLPCRNLAGETVRERVVAPDGRRWWGPGEGVHLFGLEQLTDAPAGSATVITEGESCALAAREHLPDFIVIGCPGACAWDSEWARFFEGFPRLFVIGDGDEAGREFSWRVRRDIPWARPITCPSGTDLRELLQSNRSDVVAELITDADWIARVEYEVLNARDLTSCCERLGSAVVDNEAIAAWCRAHATSTSGGRS